MLNGRYASLWARRGGCAKTDVGLLVKCRSLCRARRRASELVAALEVLEPRTLLTEQLIKYDPDDRWFPFHKDKDVRDTSKPLKTHDVATWGPGCSIVVLSLGCESTVLFEDPAKTRYALHLAPGDLYVGHHVRTQQHTRCIPSFSPAHTTALTIYFGSGV